MTTKWWKAGQCLLTITSSVLMFATVAAGGQLATLNDGSTSATLASGSAVFHFSTDQLGKGLTDPSIKIRVTVSLPSEVLLNNPDADASETFISVGDYEGGWSELLEGSVWGDETPICDFYPVSGTSYENPFVNGVANVDFGIEWPLTGGGLSSVVYVQIRNANGYSIVIQKIETLSLEEPTAAQMIRTLPLGVALINDAQGIVNSLDAKLNAALAAVDDVHANNPIAAINKLEAFLNEVYAQTGNKIKQEQADILISGGVLVVDGVDVVVYGAATIVETLRNGV